MLQNLIEAALEIASADPGPPLYQRLLAGLDRVVKCDAAALLRYDGHVLEPLATKGLSAQIAGRHFEPRAHPRLAAILSSEGPVRFEANDPRPDPYDGLMAGAVDGHSTVHSCMGCALRVQGEVVGALTIDALAPDAFDSVELETLGIFAALAGAAMRLSGLFEALRREADHTADVARQLVRDALNRDGGEILGTSLPMDHLRRELEAVARSGVPVLITGETGTGKELVARSLHAQSSRTDRPLVYVNCAALPESLAESELFGYVRGAFTGATGNRMGKFELAHQGTIFLDEVGELPLALQPKLLRALQQGELQRIGSDHAIVVDVRVLAATNRNLEVEVAEGRFRADLFHRLSVYPIHVPPLRVRGDDVALLAGVFLDRAQAQLGIGRATFTDSALWALGHHDWPGNVRELQHVVLRAAIRASAGPRPAGTTVVIGPEHLALHPCAPHAAADWTSSPPVAATLPPPAAHAFPLDLREELERYERRVVCEALERSGDNWAQAARLLGVDRSNLHRIGRRLGIHKRSENEIA